MSRVEKLRKGLLGIEPKLSSQRLYYLKQAYEETEGQPEPIRRARVLEKLLGGMPIFIDDNPIVGNLTEHRVGFQLYPEYSCGEILSEAKFFSGGDLNKKDKELIQWAMDYWRDKCVEYKARESYRANHPDRVKYEELLKAGIFTDAIGLFATRVNLDYEKVLNKGLEGVIAEAQEQLDRLPAGAMETYDKRAFLESIIIACNAVVTFAGRYAALARQMAAKEKSAERKKELEKIARTCDRVPAKPARNFYEAVQSFWFTHLVSEMEQTAAGRGPGRFPLYMYPFYKKDREAGRITRDQALELLELLFIRLAEVARFLPSDHPQQKYGRGGTVQTIALGGVTATGDDATNEIDYLVVEAQSHLRLTQPLLSLLYHDRLPNEFLMKCAELAASGLGMPMWHNNNVIITRWLNHGASLEDARNCCNTGCAENVCSHTTSVLWSDGFNLPKMLEMALNDGKDPATGKQLGPKTGAASSFKSSEDVAQAFARQLEYFIPVQAEYGNTTVTMKSVLTPMVFLSALIDDCIKTGKEVNGGGARYSFNGSEPIGMTDVADSLAAIKKVIFEDKRATLPELLKALKANFQGYETLHRQLLAAPKYGNDDDYVDLIAKEFNEFLYQEHQKYTDNLGRTRRPQGITVTLQFTIGGKVGALPSGRKAGEPLSDGYVSPAPGRDKSGVPALLSSASKVVDNVRWQATMLNLKINPDSVKGKAGLRRLLKLVKSYMDMGGHFMHLTIISADILKDAQKHPEKYQDLVVGTAGLATPYTPLDRVAQDEILRRTELVLVD